MSSIRRRILAVFSAIVLGFALGLVAGPLGRAATAGETAIAAKYAASRTVLGEPTSIVYCGLVGGGCVQSFQRGAIHWSPASGAHWSRGAIQGKWASTNWEWGTYGYPITDELCRTGTSGGTLCTQDFQRGTIKWRSTDGIIDCRVQRCVALTFDGGPSQYTGQFLDALDARNVQATFFVVGQYIDKAPATVQRAARNGNEVMNHSWDHPDLTTISYADIVWQLDTTSDKIQATVGKRPDQMRPPFGAYNSTVTQAAGSQGLAVVYWSLDTIDWRDQDAAIVRTRAARATPGSIILMHDSMPTTLAALPNIISDLKAKGYVLVPVGDLVGNPVPGRVYSRQP